MIMKIPTSPAGNDYYGHGEPPYELDADDFDGTNDLESSFEDDFSEYLWMENEEEFDKNEMKRLEEEALAQECLEFMTYESLDDNTNDSSSDRSNDQNESSPYCEVLSALKVRSALVETSTLNPLAEEFVPTLTLVPTAT